MEDLKLIAQAVWVISVVFINLHLFSKLVTDIDFDGFEKKHIVTIGFFIIEFIILTLFAFG